MIARDRRRWGHRLGCVAAALLCAGAARHAHAQGAPPSGRGGAQSGRTAPKLSAEDAALVKELALRERVALLRNLELFERGGNDEPSPTRASPRAPPPVTAPGESGP